MVKIGNKDAFGLGPSRDAMLEAPSSPIGLVESSENEVDSSNDCATPRNASSSDIDGKRSLMSSSPTDTQLKPEFNSAGDAGGFGSSLLPSSSEALDQEGVLLQATPVATDSTIIMVNELLDDDNERGTPSGTMSLSDLGFVLGSSASQGCSGGGSGVRRNASNDQIPQREGRRRMHAPRNNRHYEVGSSSSRHQPAAQQWRRVGPPNNNQTHPQQGRPEFPYPFNLRRPPGFRVPPNMNFQPPTPPPWSAAPGFATGLRVQQRGPPPPVQAPMYLYGSPAPPPSIYPTYEFATVVTARRSSGLYPPPGVTIRHPPPTSSGDPPPLPQQQPARARVTVTAPPPAPNAGQLETRPSQPAPLTPVPTFLWPPVAEEDALFTQRLHGPSSRSRRLPVFEEICPGDEPSQPPPPPSQSPPPPPSPPPPSQSPPPPLPSPPGSP